MLIHVHIDKVAERISMCISTLVCRYMSLGSNLIIFFFSFYCFSVKINNLPKLIPNRQPIPLMCYLINILIFRLLE